MILQNTNAIWGQVGQPKTSNDKITYLGEYHTFEEIDTIKYSDKVLVWHTPEFLKEEWRYGLYSINTKPTWDYVKEENITTIELNNKKIDAIFIQSYYKELQDNRLYQFLLHLKDMQNIKIPIYIFLDNESKKYIDIIKEFNINIVYVDDTKYANKISTVFYKLINYKIDTYKRILLLETDCKLKYDFINTINNDLINYDNYWIYGSYYYGNYKNPAFKNKNHINGVAIYNREPKFIMLIKDFFIKNNNINIKDNYDYILSNKIIEIDKKNKLIDSKYILNLSCPCDEKLNGEYIKNKNVICHQKCSKPKIHFITYGDDNFKKSKARILKEAEEFGEFTTITGYGPEDLDNNFKEKYKDILKEKRGGGYWIWRPYILNKKFQEIDDDDIIIFLDAGSGINPKGKTRLYEYINMFNNTDKGIISFQHNNGYEGHPHLEEKYWTTKEIFKYFNVDLNDQIINTKQFSGSPLILKKNNHSRLFVDTFLKVLENEPYLFTDKYNNNQLIEFIDNRHDQSISSIIRKNINSIIIDIRELLNNKSCIIDRYSRITPLKL